MASSASASPVVEYYQNIASVTVSCVAGVALWRYYNANKDPDYLPWFLAVAAAHCSIDLLFTRKLDVQIHHVCVVGMVVYKLMYQVENAHDAPILHLLYKTELTTIFWVLRIWYNDSRHPVERIVAVLSNIVFVDLYFRFRIVDYTALVLDEQLYQDFLPYVNTSIWSYLHVYGCFYGLYALNLYWFAIILKITYKSIVGRNQAWNSDVTNRYLVAPAYAVSFAAALHMYGQYPDLKFASFADLCGILVLTTVSYHFHTTLRELRQSGELPERTPFDPNDPQGPEDIPLDFTHKKVMPAFLTDICGIHVRCVLCAVSNFYSYEPHDQQVMLFLVIGNHLLACVAFIQAVYRCANEGRPFGDAEYAKAEWFTCVSILVTTGLLAAHCNRYLTTVELLLPLVGVFLVGRVKPFYKTNHALTHVMLFLQTITLVRVNICANQ